MISMSNAIFVLFASILVFSMTPGLDFFYGGLVSAKNVVNTMISIFQSAELEFYYLSAADTGCASAKITLESSGIFIISFWRALI